MIAKVNRKRNEFKEEKIVTIWSEKDQSMFGHQRQHHRRTSKKKEIDKNGKEKR